MRQFQIVNTFPYAAIANQINGISRIAALGNNSDVDTASVPEDVWSGSAVGVDGILNGIDHKTIQFPTTAVPMEVVSSSANDTAAGTGAQTVTVVYLDSAGTQKTATVTMNGTTAVAMPENVLFVQLLRAGTSGTVGGNNIGNISIRDSGGLGKTYAYMIAGTGFARSSGIRVPTGFTFDLLDIAVSLNRTDVGDRWASWSICLQNSAGLLLKPLELSVSTTVPYVHDTSGGLPINSIAAGTVIWIRCENVSQNNTNISAGLIGILRS